MHRLQPDKIIRYLDMADRAAKTTSSVLDCVKKLTAIGLMVVIGTCAVAISHASSARSESGIDRDREETVILKRDILPLIQHQVLTVERLDLAREQNEELQRQLSEAISELRRARK